jgi:hypothetical protein
MIYCFLLKTFCFHCCEIRDSVFFFLVMCPVFCGMSCVEVCSVAFQKSGVTRM